jgi:hypothetical protein
MVAIAAQAWIDDTFVEKTHNHRISVITGRAERLSPASPSCEPGAQSAAQRACSYQYKGAK